MLHKAGEGCGLWFDADGLPILVPMDVDDETGKCLCAVVTVDGEKVIEHGEFRTERRDYRPPLAKQELPAQFDGVQYVKDNWDRQAPYYRSNG